MGSQPEIEDKVMFMEPTQKLSRHSYFRLRDSVMRVLIYIFTYLEVKRQLCNMNILRKSESFKTRWWLTIWAKIFDVWIL